MSRFSLYIEGEKSTTSSTRCHDCSMRVSRANRHSALNRVSLAIRGKRAALFE